MKLGIAGSGMIVQEALPVLAKLGIKVEGIWARNQEKLAKLAKEWQIPAYYEEYEKMLADEKIDTIYVAVPNKYHYEFAHKALLQGKNVIMEKPFTSTWEQFQILRDLAKEKQLILLEAITTYYLPAMAEIKELLADNKLGKIHLAQVNFSQYSSRYDKFKEGIIAPVFDKDQDGGVLRDLNIYNIHFLCALFGRPSKITYQPKMEKGVDTSGVLFMEYPDLIAVAMASKACDGLFYVNLQGEKASLVGYKAVNELRDLYLFAKNQLLSRFGSEMKEHRMYYEFKAFQEIIDQRDMAKAEAGLNHSAMVMEVLAEAAKALDKE